jgi:endonuclease VIII
MAEGDSILRIGRRLNDALAGQTVAVSAPNPRGRTTGVGRLDGRVLERVQTHGKNLMLVFGELVLHSHLGMAGGWQVYQEGARWRRPRSSAWVVLGGERLEAAQFGGPTLRVLPLSRLAVDPLLGRLGPDILAPDFDAGAALRAFRATNQRRELGEALLDQQLLAGIGNIFKSESCFAAGVAPWRLLADTDDEQLRAVLGCAREQMLAAVATGREAFTIYRHRGPCVRCAGQVQSRGQGDANRISWWCARCQH